MRLLLLSLLCLWPPAGRVCLRRRCCLLCVLTATSAWSPLTLADDRDAIAVGQGAGGGSDRQPRPFASLRSETNTEQRWGTEHYHPRTDTISKRSAPVALANLSPADNFGWAVLS